jgi:uncharacterized protein
MTRSNLIVPREQIAEFCRRHRIKRLAFFGSVLRDDFSDHSDIDVLVEFEPGYTPGLHFFDLDYELSEIFGRRAEVHTAGFLSRHFRDDVLREAEVQYVAS